MNHKSGEGNNNYYHGMCETIEYKTWTWMKSRCLNPNNKRYKDYGGRGITICKEWREDFLNFYNDMGEKPMGFELDRIDNSQGYNKKNCRWIDGRTNNRNKRNINRVTINGETKLLVDWSEETGINLSTIKSRYYRGMRGEDLIKPRHKPGPK